MDNLKIGEKVKFYRKRAGLSQLALEISTNASFGSISKIENNLINPSKEILFKMIDSLKLNPYESASLFNIDLKELDKFSNSLVNANESFSKEESYDYINDFLDLSLSNTQEELFNNLIKTIHKTLGVTLIAILTYDNERKDLRLSKTSLPNTIEKIVTVATEKYIHNVRYLLDDENIFKLSIDRNEILYTSNISLTLEPIMKKLFARQISRMVKTQMKMIVTLPLVYSDKRYGVIALGWRRDFLSITEIKFLQVISKQISLAMKSLVDKNY